jgi:AcrR family transcriptional regulator
MGNTVTANSQKSRRDNRKCQVLAEATRIIAERGYHGFGLQELAERCGMSKPGLLHHFGSKEQLLIEVLQERDRQDELAVASVTGLARHGMRADELSLETVKSLFAALVARNATQPELVRLNAMLRAEALSPRHPAHDYFLQRSAETISEYAKVIAPHVGQPHETARQLTALMGGLELLWLREEQGFDLAEQWTVAAAKLLS